MDLSIFESGNGGDVILKGGDLEQTDGLFNQPYLAGWGGNIEQTTEEAQTEQQGVVERFDWWGNLVLFQDSPENQFNSLFERALNETTLSSSGRAKLESRLRSDLDFMKPLASITVSVSLKSHSTSLIKISILEPSGLEQRNLIFLWDGTRLEDIEKKTI